MFQQILPLTSLRLSKFILTGFLLFGLCFESSLYSQEDGKPTEANKTQNDNEVVETTKPAEAATDESQLMQRQETLLADMLDKTKLTGLFTMTGKPMTDLTEESYEIKSVKRVSGSENWAIVCRIKYGKNDLVVPIVVTIKWAGETPVIYMDDLTIPLMGTFSARVVFHDGKYAGTWQHDEVGGHLFGNFEKMPVESVKE